MATNLAQYLGIALHLIIFEKQHLPIIILKIKNETIDTSFYSIF